MGFTAAILHAVTRSQVEADILSFPIVRQVLSNDKQLNFTKSSYLPTRAGVRSRELTVLPAVHKTQFTIAEHLMQHRGRDRSVPTHDGLDN